jgi:hypothetical protein
MNMTPALGVNASGIGADIEKLGPRPIIERGWIGGPRDVRLVTVGKFQFRSRAAMGAANNKHEFFPTLQ